ncbi:ribonuclease H-like protein [Hypoxylon sp. FL1150]|nr:ribonuclease H-like protein [Hypoxylon sp. FL1150]
MSLPIEWYISRGLFPPSPLVWGGQDRSSEFPSYKNACRAHCLDHCGICDTDNTTNDSLDNSENEDDGFTNKHVTEKANHNNFRDASLAVDFEDLLYPRRRRGTGRVFPTRFIPPTYSILPTNLFCGTRTFGNLTRYIHRHNPRTVLIITDGACLNNGQPNPMAGWAFVHGPGLTNDPAIVSGRLESKGPFGDDAAQTSNRAELRAVIAALRFRHWPGEGFNTMTIATDSEYVVEGSTLWAKSWVMSNWKTRRGADVKNRDMWEVLLGEFERCKDAGLSINFWRIPREWNQVADAAAKKAASEVTQCNEWMEVMGTCI